jgi:hypothetical protein
LRDHRFLWAVTALTDPVQKWKTENSRTGTGTAVMDVRGTFDQSLIQIDKKRMLYFALQSRKDRGPFISEEECDVVVYNVAPFSNSPTISTRDFHLDETHTGYWSF